ncbi:MAG: hypothetical protein EZS28_004795 [Streblomastix strix]|uniref:Helicase C-terminal domain-containing protein n=1 Tax=Streblomastix strix TaxID=222440 RepID=A0A5J4WYX0_9EUKA|nr:MAG: hypothetical protein EZS28_004795 [Streblomastix strix]
MLINAQKKVVREFRTNRANLLFATNVAEEGLDFQPCNIVVRFDSFENLPQYLQSRGRARRRQAIYGHLCEDGDEYNYMNKQLDKNRFCEDEILRFAQNHISQQEV